MSAISLREAHATLEHGTARLRADVGILLRGNIRQSCAMLGIDYYEEKSCLNSVFVFRGRVEKMRLLENHFRRLEE